MSRAFWLLCAVASAGVVQAQDKTATPLELCAEELRHGLFFKFLGRNKAVLEGASPYAVLLQEMQRPFFDLAYLVYACDHEAIDIRQDPVYLARRGLRAYLDENADK